MPKTETKKKPYQKPKLKVYGKITDLTAAQASGAVKDGVGNKKT